MNTARALVARLPLDPSLEALRMAVVYGCAMLLALAGLKL